MPITASGYEGEKVTIRASRSWKAAKDIESASLRFSPDSGSMVGTVDLYEKGIATMEHAIVSWSLEQPPTRAYFESDGFGQVLGEWLVASIEEFYESGKKTDEDRLV